MDQYIYSITLYVLGMAFILCIFEPEENENGGRLVLVALVWPIYTLYLIFLELMGTFRE